MRQRIVLGLLFIYTFMLGLMIWATVEANTNPGDYEAFIIKKGYFNTIAGVIIGIGFLPVILILLVLAIFLAIASAIVTLIIVAVPLAIALGFFYFFLLSFVHLLSCCNCPYSKIVLDKLKKAAFFVITFTYFRLYRDSSNRTVFGTEKKPS